MDELEMARSSLASGSRTAGAGMMRDGSTDIRSVANVQKLSMLQEIYPSVAVEIMEDVLVAAQFRMDVAASMLGELSRELLGGEDSPERADLVLVDWAALQEEASSDDGFASEHWHEVSESRPEMQQWVLVQDDWEVIDGVQPADEKTRSYADALRTSAEKVTVTLPQLSPVQPMTSLSPLVRAKKSEASCYFDDADDLSAKSFGTRKRRFLRKHRG